MLNARERAWLRKAVGLAVPRWPLLNDFGVFLCKLLFRARDPLVRARGMLLPLH